MASEPREKLLRDFSEIKFMEIKAGQMYTRLLPFIQEPEDKKILEGIIRDEAKHAELAQQIIDLVTSHPE